MNNLYTSFKIKQLNNKIDYNSQITSIGSCFAVNISNKLNYFKINNIVNPFGILFHPLAIEQVVKRCVNNQLYTAEDVFFHNEIWSCFEAHSELNSILEEDIIKSLNNNLLTLKNNLENSTHFILTLGTAWVYKHIERNQYVANCHKVPQKKFKKELLSVSTILNSLRNIEQNIRSINEKIQFICTISPVRHIKDGFVENQVSKSHLISALYTFIEENPHHYYFPSYEIMMDELRDYRFYNNDMIHPNDLAINIIWQKFIDNCISPQIFAKMKKVDDIQKSIAHKPFNPNSDTHKKFLLDLENKIKEVGLTF